MLTNVRNYLRERPFASLIEIAQHLEVSPDVARSVCDVWIARGKITTVAEDATRRAACQQCSMCAPAAREFYRWVD